MGKRDFTEREKEMAFRVYRGKETRYLREVIASGNLSSISGGTFAPRFEAAFAKMIGARYAAAMNSGMSALHTAVVCAQAGAGTEVICDPEFVFGPLAVLYNNALPVFVDIDPVTHNMNPDKIEAAITKRTRAIIVTHAWGLPAAMDRIMRIARRHKLMVIEDCAQSVLATYKGRYTGSWGDIGCFSFQASKQLSLGDGGMATTNRKGLYAGLANFAGAPTLQSVAYGMDFNYRMNEPTAAIGLAQVESLPAFLKKLARNAAHYDKAVDACPWLKLQRGPKGAAHSFYHWAATFCGEEQGLSLKDFKKAVARQGMSSLTIGYTGMAAYEHPLIKGRLAHAFHCSANKTSRKTFAKGACPVAEQVVPRLAIAYLVESESTAKREAEKLYSAIQQVQKG